MILESRPMKARKPKFLISARQTALSCVCSIITRYRPGKSNARILRVCVTLARPGETVPYASFSRPGKLLKNFGSQKVWQSFILDTAALSQFIEGSQSISCSLTMLSIDQSHLKHVKAMSIARISETNHQSALGVFRFWFRSLNPLTLEFQIEYAWNI